MSIYRTVRRQRLASEGSPRGLVRQFASAAMGLVYPPMCPACQRPQANAARAPSLCRRCTRQLADSRPACRRCARPLPNGIPQYEHGRCPGCRNKRLAFERAIAIGVYGGDLRDIVLRIKKPGQDSLAIVVGKFLAEKCLSSKSFTDIDLLVPTPIHWTRRFVRGGSCPELLVEAMSSVLKVPAATRLLKCRRGTRKQGTLLPNERRRNVRHAYRVSKSYNLKGAHILMVDDVMTTGATANEMARALRKSGASTISLAVVARAIGFDGQ